MKKVQNIAMKHALQLFLVVVSISFALQFYPQSGFSNFSFFRAINATISAPKTVICKDEIIEITFNASGGTAPYTFNYTENGTSRSVVSDGAGRATISNNGAVTGDFVYILQTVQDNDGTVENIAGQQVSIKVNEPLVVDFTFTNDGGVLW